jgi:predicted DCC family thiol-disulfide oxidoreductase YuxK
MNAVITERTSEAAQGWVFYDSQCSLCTAAVLRFGPMLRRHHFEFAPLQAMWVQQRIGLNSGELLTEMKLLTANGRIYGGADALLQIARTIWLAWLLYALAQIPGVKILFRAIYRYIATNRKCFNGACSIRKPLGRHHKTRAFFEIP